jgi:hypothetical protein
LTFYTQIWGLDPTANPFGHHVELGVHHIVSRTTAGQPRLPERADGQRN